MLRRIGEIESVVLKALAIIGIIIVGTYATISVIGNIAIARANRPVEVKYPDIVKAPYQLTVTTTGQKLFLEKYEKLGEGVYMIDRYYVDKDGKYVLVKTPFVVDERVWGKLILADRR